MLTLLSQVDQKDLWPVIGAKLGFDQFPGNGNEPGKAGPALAAHLEHIYKEFLLDFDTQYLRQLFHHRRQLLPAQYQKNAAAGPSAMDGSMSLQNGPPTSNPIHLPLQNAIEMVRKFREENRRAYCL